MKDLIEYIARSLVDSPDDVEVTEFGDDQASMITLKVAQDDLGKVIGKKGRTAKAMRTILSAASTKLRKRSTLEIMEPEQQREREQEQAEQQPEQAPQPEPEQD